MFIIGCSNSGVDGVVIGFFNKDYELQSWNEQGEITHFEGMLTICFLVVSPCSHRDKKLYLIIKIPYLVNMSKKEIIAPNGQTIALDLDEYVELTKEVPKLKKRIDELMDKTETLEVANSILQKENEELDIKSSKLESEIKKHIELQEELLDKYEILNRENHRLKIVSGEAKSGWIQERDLVRRPHPITGKPDGYRCPFDFNFNLVEYLDIYFSDEKGEKWCRSFHPYPKSGSSTKPFDMPHTGYLFLKEELPEQKKKRTKKSKIQKLEFKEKDDIIEQLENYFIDSDRNISQLEYLDKAINFLWEFKDMKDKDKKFGTGDFRKNLDFCSPGTVDSYIDMFVECEIIIRLGRGSYRVNFK